MKRKTIKKVMRKKISQWIDSIEDGEIRAAVRKDTIVTGGSIASMLLGEPVNDFDIYFKTLETTRVVAEYYVKQFKKSHPDFDLVRVEVLEKTDIRGNTETRVCIIIPSEGVAGDNPDNEEDEVLEEKEVVEEGDYRPVFLSENAITLSDKIQIISRFHGDPEKIHSNFDFAHAMNWYRYSNNYLELNPLALECLLSRTLIYKGSLYPVCSIFRVRKFMSRGWKISAGQLLKIMWQISELDLNDHEILREQLTGVDALYFAHLVEALADLDKDRLNSTYIGSIIDSIFQD